MIKRVICFKTRKPLCDGVYLSSKESVVREILSILAINDYQFHPFYRPEIPLLVNFNEDKNSVSYQDLVVLLRRLYEYCSTFPDTACLNEYTGVVVRSNGVYTSRTDGQLLYVVQYMFDGSELLPLPETRDITPLSQLSYVVKKFFANDYLTNKKVFIEA